ncbi:hypothetical protein Q0M94_18930 (plasmid) [Deinococcus radiomollis]
MNLSPVRTGHQHVARRHRPGLVQSVRMGSVDPRMNMALAISPSRDLGT